MTGLLRLVQSGRSALQSNPFMAIHPTIDQLSPGEGVKSTGALGYWRSGQFATN